MSARARHVEVFLACGEPAILVEIAQALGSTPRDKGAFMLVSATKLIGTIGGGQMEFLALDAARAVLAGRKDADALDLVLGPEIGQCCGGRMQVTLRRIDKKLAAEIGARARKIEEGLPRVLMFGAGHVGQALARALLPLPVRGVLVDTRPAQIADLPNDLEARVHALPEALVREAPPGSAFVVFTHDHGLDFQIVGESLRRKDASYVGMIGSKTKRARFSSWFLAEGGTQEEILRLISPIGGKTLADKRPEVIAALAAAEILVHIAALH